MTEGKIGIDEDRSTPVYSPYTGRVTRLLVRPGDAVVKGQPLFVIEAADTVQAQNDYVAAMTGLNKAQSALDLAQIQEKRAKDLSDGKAIPHRSARPGEPPPQGTMAMRSSRPRRGPDRRSREP